MRIISNFRDYYDSAQALGIDKSLVYERKEVVLELDPRSIPLNFRDYPVRLVGDYPNESLKRELYVYYLFFCGKLFTSVNIGEALLEKDTKPFSSSWEYISEVFDKLANESSYGRFFGRDIDVHTVKSLNGKEITSEVFSYFDTPVFLLYPNFGYQYNRKVRVVKNPNLSQLGFQHVIDPYSTFQEISTYLGNELCKVATPTSPTNQELIKARGFDAKISFRQGSPGAKKEKRRANKAVKKLSKILDVQITIQED